MTFVSPRLEAAAQSQRTEQQIRDNRRATFELIQAGAAETVRLERVMPPPGSGMPSYIQIDDGFTKSIGASTCDALRFAVAEYYGIGEDELEFRETDDGDVLAYVGGPNIGFVRRRKV